MSGSKKLIGEMIKEQRIKRGLTLDELAAKLETDRQYIWKLEKGQINMSLDYLDRILKALNTNIKDFFKNS